MEPLACQWCRTGSRDGKSPPIDRPQLLARAAAAHPLPLYAGLCGVGSIEQKPPPEFKRVIETDPLRIRNNRGRGRTTAIRT